MKYSDSLPVIRKNLIHIDSNDFFLVSVKKKPPSLTWRTFIKNHMPETCGMDFFTVPTATFRILYVFVILSHDRRKVVHFNVTEHPYAEWAALQVVQSFPWEEAPKYMIRDRDSIYGGYFRKRLRAMDIK